MNKERLIRLTEPFFARETVIVARDLIGMTLVHVVNGNILAGAIIETEAYTFEDPASHAYGRQTARNAPLFGPVGRCYVYFIYGMHYCINAVSRAPEQRAGGVLIRAVQPLLGIEYMKQNRGVDDVQRLAAGPGMLTQAFGITKKDNNRNLLRDETLFIAEPLIDVQEEFIKATPRIGISKAKEIEWRFVYNGLITGIPVKADGRYD